MRRTASAGFGFLRFKLARRRLGASLLDHAGFEPEIALPVVEDVRPVQNLDEGFQGLVRRLIAGNGRLQIRYGRTLFAGEIVLEQTVVNESEQSFRRDLTARAIGRSLADQTPQGGRLP